MKSMKKILLLAVAMATLTVMFVFGAISAGAAENVPFSGNGTEGDPYLITSVEELVTLSQLVNGGNDFAGKHIKLTKGLSLSGKAWEPIGTSHSPFAGTFLGGGFTISDLTINHSERVSGLFGCVTGRIEGLNVSGTVTVSSERTLYAGLLCGKLFGSVANCSAAGTVTASSARNVYAGGICGYAYDSAQVTVSTTVATVSATSAQKNVYAGSLVGCLAGKAEGCKSAVSSGMVAIAENGVAYAGTICGYIYYGKYISNYCTVQTELAPFGGICTVATGANDNAIDVGELLNGETNVNSMAAEVIASENEVFGGEEITVDVKLSLNPGVSGLKLSFAYDKTRFKLIGASYGVFDTVITSQTVDVYPYVMVYLSADGIAANEIIATLTFTVLNTATPGYADIGLTVAECVDENGNGVSCDAVDIDGGVTVVKMGDANGDGMVNTSDATLILKKLAGENVALDEKQADANGDGKVNTSDATWILKSLV